MNNLDNKNLATNFEKVYEAELLAAKKELEGMDTLTALEYIESKYKKALGEC